MAWNEPGHLAGIARYAREKGWILESVSPGQEQMQKPGEVDGVICQLHPDFPEHTRRVSALRVPKVEMSHYHPRAGLPRITWKPGEWWPTIFCRTSSGAYSSLGMSVAAYVKQERLNAAKKLLIETSKPINVIARECGYSSSWILIRTLKRDAGITPMTYRQKHQAD